MNKNFYSLLPLLLLIFIDSFSYFVVIPILLQLFYQDSYGLLPPTMTETRRNLLTGFTLALSTFSSLIAAPFIGEASDRYGRKKTLLVCVGLMMSAFIIPIIGILKKNIYLILIGRVLAGMGSVSQAIAQAAVADRCRGGEKSIFLSLIALMMTLALILGPLVGGYLSQPHLVKGFNLMTPYWFALVLAFLSFILLIFFFKETLTLYKPSDRLILITTIREIRASMKRYKIKAFLLIFFCLEWGWSQYYQSIFLYLSQRFHYTAQQVGLFNMYLGIWMAIALLVLYPLLIRYFSVLKIMRVSIVLTAGGLGICAIWPTLPIQWIFIPCISGFTGCAYVSLVTLVSNHMPADHQGRVMGYLSTLLFSAWMLSGISSGGLISLYSSLPLYVAAGFLFAAAFFIRLTAQRY